MVSPLISCRILALITLFAFLLVPFESALSDPGIHAVPGTIQAEDFDNGGEGVAYHETSTANQGGAYRLNEAVDIEPSTDAGGGYNIGWTQAGEWLNYTVNVASAGTYTLEARVASAGGGGAFHIEFNGVNKTGALDVPNTGDWQAWQTLTRTVTLAAGQQVMRIVMERNGLWDDVGSINYIRLTAAGGSPSGSTPFYGTPFSLPATIQAEDYDNGGEGIAYHDAVATNEKGAYRNDDVDIEAFPGGFNLAETRAGEWTVYSINVPTSGTYTLEARVGSFGAGGNFRVEFDGVNKTGSLTVPDTGDWQSFVTISAPVALTAGTQRMRVVLESNGASGYFGNLDYFRLSPQGGSGNSPPPPPSGPTVPVGATAGEFRVNQNGGAVYNIPLVVAPGTAGMAPKLTLTYDRQVSNGRLGMGWFLGGLPLIHRCGRTYALDSAKSSVNYDVNDRFCLDGQRLIAIKTGSVAPVYGADGTEYRTEKESFMRIVSHGAIPYPGGGSGPSYFTATMRDGTVMEYGNTSDSRVEASGKTAVRVWAVNKMQDTKGNYLTVSYGRGNSYSEFWPLRIDYTGNSAAGLASYNSVRLSYEAQPLLPEYTGGSGAAAGNRVASIKSYTGETLVRDYRLVYTNDGQTSLPGGTARSRLTGITECGTDGVCLPTVAVNIDAGNATSLNPQGGISVITSDVCANGSSAYGGCNDADNFNSIQYPDINGDGRADLCFRSDNGIICHLSNAMWSGFTLPTGSTSGAPSKITTDICANGSNAYGVCNDGDNHSTIAFADFNGDGKADLVYRGDQGIQVWLSMGSGFVLGWSSDICANGSSNYGVCNDADNYSTIQYPDIDGDGRADLCFRGDNGINCFLSTGSGWGTRISTSICANGSQEGGICNDAENYDTIRFADFNGDGMADLVYRGDQGVQIWLSTGTGFTSTNWFSTPVCVAGEPYGCNSADNFKYLYYPDINGDGLADVCVRMDNGIGCYMSTGKGTGWYTGTLDVCANGSTKYGTCDDADNFDSITFADMNGDGMADLVYRSNSGVRVWLSTGITFKEAWATDICANGSGAYGGCSDADNIYSLRYVDQNGDGLADIVFRSDAGIRVVLTSGTIPGLLKSVTNGIPSIANIDYRPLTAGDYVKGTGASYPYQDIQNSFYVVSRVTHNDGAGGQYLFTYSYRGAKAYLKGPGWLGFELMGETDNRSSAISAPNSTADTQTRSATTNTYFHQTYDGRQGLPSLIETWHVHNAYIMYGTTLIKRQTNSWSSIDLGSLGTGLTFGRLDGSLIETVELDPRVGGVTCTQNDQKFRSFDEAGKWGDYGSPYEVKTQIDATCSFVNPFVVTTTNTYNHDNGVLGKLARREVRSEAPGQSAITRVSTFEYNALGLLREEASEPDQQSMWLKSTHNYDSFGNRRTTTVTGADIASRTNAVVYDGRGQFAASVTNAEGHVSTTTYDDRSGQPLTQTDPNDLTVAMAYDGFGRKSGESRPDGTTTSITYAACSTGCPALAQYAVTTQSSGAAPSKTFHDFFGRVIRTETIGLNGRSIYQDVEYDGFGRVARKSVPYFAGDSIYWNVIAYDFLGRVVRTTEADGTVVRTVYAALTSTVEWSGPDITTRSRTTLTNAAGKPVSVTDSLYPDRATRYGYDAAGNLTRITDPAGNITSIGYDLRGRKITMSDPDMGNWSYRNNVLGEVLSQTDAKGQLQSATYDLLGRLKTRTISEGVSTWTYDTSPRGIGRIASVSGPNGFGESYSYDNAGRISAVTVTVDGESYNSTTTYHAVNGQPESTTYPQTGFAVLHVYDDNGYLREIRNRQTNERYWQASDTDARNQLTREQFGNGVMSDREYEPKSGLVQRIHSYKGTTNLQDLSYRFDVLGNLLRRADDLQGIAETFSYDTLNRLTAVTGPSAKNFAYDAIGNISYKSDVGNYSYAAKPHAVTGTNGLVNATYAYDPNGNMISGAGRTISYTSFNKPAQITASGIVTAFGYDAQFNRVKKSNANGTTIYIGKLYERVTRAGVVEHRHYIKGGTQTVAIYTQRNTGSNDTRYLHTDHLGSIDALTDASGSVVQRLSYDAHGKRRQPNWQDATGAIAPTVTVGFTGHEMDDEYGLINMNARLYDPMLGRFITPDSSLEAPFGQGLNRYTYVNNNPLSYTDPTGNKSWRKKIVGAVKVVVGLYIIYKSGGDPLIGAVGAALIVSGVKDLNGCKRPCGSEVNIPVFEINFGSGSGSGSGSSGGGPGGGRGDGRGSPAGNGGSGADGDPQLLKVVVGDPADYPDLPNLGWRPPGNVSCTDGGLCIDWDGAVQALDISSYAFPVGAVFRVGGTAVSLGIRGLAHVIERHTAGGALSAGKSIFNVGEDFYTLANAAASAPPVASGSNFVRIVDAGRPIGIDRATGQSTSLYTVVTDRAGNVVTMHPGKP